MQTEFFANFGTGFHSNDARAVVQDATLPALAQATGWEVGVRTHILPRVEVSITYWWLNLSSELVFNGDEGTLEPSGATHRRGLEFSLKAKPLDWLTFTGNVTYTAVAEFFNGAAIPLAPFVTAFTDVTVRLPWGLSMSATVRYVSNRWADEDRHQTAPRLHPPRLRRPLPVPPPRRPRARRLREHREPRQCAVARSAVLQHLAASGGAAPGRERHPLHARATRAPSWVGSRFASREGREE